ncbi:MAG: hypothetical protein O6761_02440 [Thaumarchaeota archaeon]|nr:hypothetical protein [Nitrososphaerota archaeon]
MVLVNSFFVLTIVVLIAISIVPFTQLVSADHISVQVSIPTGKERECVETNSCYSPSSLTIDVGSTVMWKNEDQSRHTITSGDLLQSAYNVGTNYPNGFDSPLLEIGDTWAHTFDTPGEYPYFSKAKPWMVGVVIVKTDLTAPEVVVEEGEPSPEEVIVEAETSPEEIIVEEGESESQETLPTSEPLDSEIFLDPFIFTEIGEGEPLILTGQLLTVDGMPIAEKEVYVEYMDSGGDIFFSYETTDSDGEFFSEIYFYIAGESSVFVEFEGDAEFNGTSDFIVADITFMSESASLMEEPAEPESGGGIELPSIELPSIELPSVELPGGGCLIATAAFDSEMAPQVQLLREIRDNIVLNTESGTTFLAGFNEIYYSFSPTVADWERHNPIFKETVKLAITPLLTTLSILNYVDIDSEAEMLGYGIGIILLNIGTYFVLPAFLIIKIRGTVKF